MTISEAFIAYDTNVLYPDGYKLKTRTNYRTALNSFVKANGDLPIQFISELSVKQWIVCMRRDCARDSYINSNISHLRKIIKYAKKLGISVVDYRDIERIKERPIKRTFLTVDEIVRFIAVIDSPRDKALFACLFSTGARISELLQLNRGDIVDGSALTIGKGDKERTLDFGGYALTLLDTYLAIRRDTLRPLFISGQYRRIGVSRVEQLAHIYEDKAEIDKNITPHVFRHSFASDMKENGNMDIYDLQQQLGHANVSTTANIYTHTSNKRKKIQHDLYHSKIPL